MCMIEHLEGENKGGIFVGIFSWPGEIDHVLKRVSLNIKIIAVSAKDIQEA